jgi:sortase A
MSALSARIPLIKTVLKRSLWILAIVGYVFSVALLLRFITKSHPTADTPLRPVAAKKITPEPMKFGVPVRLAIASIKIDSVIAPAGLTPEGAMDIKKDPDQVAWYNLGPRPGNVGSAVIAGHYGWDNGHGSVFNDLHTLKAGDEVSVSDEKGTTVSFIVKGSRLYDPNADASEIFKSSDGKSHLNLITCEGVWSSQKQTYSERLVVFTDKK